MSAIDLDAIEARAKRDVLTCDECDAPATRVCNASECGATRCDAHAIEYSGHCDHRWYPRRSLAADVLALVALARAPRRHGDAVTPRIYTAAEARALREAAPAGPYEAMHPDDLPGRSLVSGGREVRPPYDAFCVGLEDRVRVPLAELFAASPDLAATVEAQAAEIERLQRERDALRDAAREYLDADDRDYTAWNTARTRLAALVGDATMRRDLPAEAVVSCPACGYGCTADLDDDGAYVMRQHSRRETARVGLGDIVWCDGGVVRTVAR